MNIKTLYHIHSMHKMGDTYTSLIIDRFFDNLVDACKHVIKLKDEGFIAHDIRTKTIKIQEAT